MKVMPFADIGTDKDDTMPVRAELVNSPYGRGYFFYDSLDRQVCPDDAREWYGSGLIYRLAEEAKQKFYQENPNA